MQFEIRPYHPSDLTSLYRICLSTANSGKDATELYKNPDLVGHFYVAPYVLFEPDVCFVITNNKKPCGYIIGTKNSQEFHKRCEESWFPVLKGQFAKPTENDKSLDARIINLIHQGHKVKDDVVAYSAHLHIDLLPEAQGQGLGRKAMDVFINRLRELNVEGLHLEVGKKNHNAIEFYKRIGFNIIKEYEYSIVFGMKL